VAQSLLKTKFYPPAPRKDLIQRPALVERLQNALTHKLTLVSAPAGFGKTTMVALWLANLDIPTAWISLDESDNDGGMFLTYVVSAVENLQEKYSGLLRNELPSDESGSGTSTLTALINDISQLEKPLVLVLEDYHLIHEQAVHQAVMFLLNHLPPKIHLVILTRSDPPFPLSRMRGRGELYELRTADLQFTNQEVRRYLTETLQLTLTNDQIQTLTQRTEGWIVGLQMAGLSLRGRTELATNQFIHNLSSNQAYVLDYLADEVLNIQPAHVQEFLLKTSILEHLTGDLCDRLTGQTGGGELLKQLQADNLFLFPLDQDNDWYRYHLLFSELLRNRLRKQGASAQADLHQRACDWYMTQGMFDDAISHALAASDYERAVILMENHSLDVIFRGEFTKIKGWLQTLPADVLHSNPLLCITLAWASVQPETLTQSEEMIQAAEAKISGSTNSTSHLGIDQSLRKTIIGHAATLRAVIARARDEAPQRQLDLTHKALEVSSDDDKSLQSVLALRLGLSHLDQGDESEASCQFDQAIQLGKASNNQYALTTAYYCQTMIALRSGYLQKAAALCKEAIRTARTSLTAGRPLPINGVPYVMLGVIYLEWNDLDYADQILREGLALLDAVGLYQDAEIKLKGYYALARLQIARGEFQSLPDLNEIGQQGKPFLRTLAAGMQTSLAIRVAELSPDRDMLLAQAVEWAERHLAEPKEDLYWDWEMIKDLTYLRVKLAQQRSSGKIFIETDFINLLQRLRGIFEIAKQRNWLSIVLESCILQALLLQANGQILVALESLGQALKIASQQRYIRVFLDEGDPMRRLLYKAIERGIEPEYAGKLLGLMKQSDQFMQPFSERYIEPLTRREIDVLKLLAKGLTNKEIGQQLSISLGTVKRHTANINGKLGVSNRTQAVMQAQILGILTS
jgi:LuxR family maltose regulon positive regulatory protein